METAWKRGSFKCLKGKKIGFSNGELTEKRLNLEYVKQKNGRKRQRKKKRHRFLNV